MDTSVQFNSVTQSCLALCDPLNCSTPGHPVHHQLPEFTQTHVHWVGDAIQPSHPLSSPSPPAPNPSQHQSLFQWVNSSHEEAKILEFQPQHQSFQWHVGNYYFLAIVWACSVLTVCNPMTVFHMGNYYRNANQNKNEVPLKNPTNHKRWRGCGEKGALLPYWWECKLIQSFWRTVWRFLKKVKNRLTTWSCNPTLENRCGKRWKF